MKKELKLRVERFGKTVIGEVLDMDESERGRYLLYRLEDNKLIKELISYHYPYITYNKIYIRGKFKQYDNDVFQKTFNTEEESQQGYEDILRLVEEYNKQLNKPKFEESEEYKKQVKMNELLMDMKKWQFENDEKVDPTNIESLYCLYVNLNYGIRIEIDYSKALEIRNKAY